MVVERPMASRAAVAVAQALFWADLPPGALLFLGRVLLVEPTTLGLALVRGVVALVVVPEARGKLATPLRNLVV
jgi:hypothetical protein